MQQRVNDISAQYASKFSIPLIESTFPSLFTGAEALGPADTSPLVACRRRGLLSCGQEGEDRLARSCLGQRTQERKVANLCVKNIQKTFKTSHILGGTLGEKCTENIQNFSYPRWDFG